MKRFGRHVKRLREARGLTQAGLARKARTSQQYVSLLEVGARRRPAIDVVMRFARALGVPVTELLE